MDNLDEKIGLGLLKKQAIVLPIKKKHEYKLIGSLRYRKGLKLYAINEDENVYLVDVLDKKVLDLDKGAGIKKAVINPNHRMVWALNVKNAIRKLK